MRKCVRGLQNKSNQNSLASSTYGELPGQVDLLIYISANSSFFHNS